MGNRFDAARELINSAGQLDAASIINNQTGEVDNYQSNVFDLNQTVHPNNGLGIGVYNPIELPPGKYFFVPDASDSNAVIYVAFNKQKKFIAVRKLFSIEFERATAGCFVYWTQQPGKTLTLYSSTAAKQSNNQLTVSSAAATDGASFVTGAAVTVGTTAVIIAPQDFDRKCSLIQNMGGSDLYVGDSSVTGWAGAKPGIKIPSASVMEFRNTGALYGIRSTATELVAYSVEK